MTVFLVFDWIAETSQGARKLMIQIKQYQWAFITYWNAMCGLLLRIRTYTPYTSLLDNPAEMNPQLKEDEHTNKSNIDKTVHSSEQMTEI